MTTEQQFQITLLLVGAGIAIISSIFTSIFTSFLTYYLGSRQRERERIKDTARAYGKVNGMQAGWNTASPVSADPEEEFTSAEERMKVEAEVKGWDMNDIWYGFHEGWAYSAEVHIRAIASE